MPELPEVETTRRGIAPLLEARAVSDVVVRQPKLRWPVTPGLRDRLRGQELMLVERRAKYLLLRFPHGTLIMHLGMSGSLRVLPADTPAESHDHVDIVFGDRCLRLRDPRRFGAVLWHGGDADRHKLLANVGPEPLSDAFDTPHLAKAARGRKVAIKQLIMDSKVVVGVGNIYANEALYMARIHPQRAAGRIGRARLARLVATIKQVLAAAIEQGGTTLRDFQREDGRPGYFAQELQVYGRGGLPCPSCGRPLKESRLGQRSTVYCGHCQR
jgi:formamidopyrimidine-DNA glycosylase